MLDEDTDDDGMMHNSYSSTTYPFDLSLPFDLFHQVDLDDLQSLFTHKPCRIGVKQGALTSK